MKESSLKLAKKVTVSEITNKISSAKAIAFAEYRGLTVAQLKEMRVEAKKVGVELKVYKNRLFKLATDKLGYDLSSFLVGANIFAFSNDDNMSAAKLLVKFAKKHKEFLVLKAGTFEGKVVDTQELKKVAALPSYEEALTILARSLMAPLQQLSLGLKLVSEQKSN